MSILFIIGAVATLSAAGSVLLLFIRFPGDGRPELEIMQAKNPAFTQAILRLLLDRMHWLRMQGRASFALVFACLGFGFVLLYRAESLVNGMSTGGKGVEAVYGWIAIRIGIVVLTIYACQLLLRFFRYSSMKADAIRALIDAQLLMGAPGYPTTIGETLGIVQPKVDFRSGTTFEHAAQTMEYLRGATKHLEK